MNANQDQEVISKVQSAVVLHRESKQAMVDRIKQLLDPLPGHMVIEVSGHKIAYRAVNADCSPWVNHAYPVTGSARAYIIDDQYTLGPVDCSFYDGHNQQEQFGRVRLGGSELREARAATIREIAVGVKQSLLSYAACCEAGAAENTAVTKAL